jgi:hypothetical protein
MEMSGSMRNQYILRIYQIHSRIPTKIIGMDLQQEILMILMMMTTTAHQAEDLLAEGHPGEDPEEFQIHGDLDSLEDLMEPLEELHREDHREEDHPMEEEAVGHKTLDNLANYKIQLMTDSNSTRNSKYLMSLLGMATPTISSIGWMKSITCHTAIRGSIMISA